MTVTPTKFLLFFAASLTWEVLVMRAKPFGQFCFTECAGTDNIFLTVIFCKRERERETQRETDRERQTERERQRGRQRERKTERQKENMLNDEYLSA